MPKTIVLRQRPRINYYEPEEPNLDEYIFCDKCGDFVYEYCSIHGPLLVIPDDKVNRNEIPAKVPRAALTIPKLFLHLAPSIIPGAGLGVFASKWLPRGVRFGPYRGRRATVAHSNYCWQLYSGSGRASHVVDAGDAGVANWMRYVNCARHWHEQNLIAYQYRGQLYYRTIKTIPRSTELMVYYGSKFAKELHIDIAKYNSPAGYAQKFGTPISKSKNNVSPETAILQKKEINKIVSPQKNTQNSSVLRTNNTCVDSNKFLCEVCNWKCVFKEDLVKHMRFHENSRPHVCEVCEYRFSFLSSLNRHKAVVHKIGITKEYVCNDCDHKFAQKHHLTEHLRTHTGEKPFSCNICSYKCVQKHHLTGHLRTHTGEKPFSCNICSYKCVQKHHLTEHLRTHTGEKPFSCNFCDYKCTLKCNLTRHNLRTHSGEKPFSCNICSYKCVEKSNLTKHLRTHTGEKPFSCNICEFESARRNSLKQHLITKHLRSNHP